MPIGLCDQPFEPLLDGLTTHTSVVPTIQPRSIIFPFTVSRISRICTEITRNPMARRMKGLICEGDLVRPESEEMEALWIPEIAMDLVRWTLDTNRPGIPSKKRSRTHTFAAWRLFWDFSPAAFGFRRRVLLSGEQRLQNINRRARRLREFGESTARQRREAGRRCESA